MKIILTTIIAAIACLFTGCKSTPTVDMMYTTSTAVGKAAAYIANQTKIDERSRMVIIDIMTTASEVVPSVDQSFVDAWAPIAKEITDSLVKEGKLDGGQAALVQGAFAVACKGMDYLVEIRFPKAKQYENLVSAAVKGFNEGFLTVFKPSNTFAAGASDDFDRGAYEYLLNLK